jgi:hypothetical protein
MRLTKGGVMDENEDNARLELSTGQELGKVLVAATVAFAVTRVVNKMFDQAVVAIREYKAK